MTDEQITKLMDLAWTTGIYMVAKLAEDGFLIDPSKAGRLTETCAKIIERETGMPAEDYATTMQPKIDVMIAQVKERGQA